MILRIIRLGLIAGIVLAAVGGWAQPEFPDVPMVGTGERHLIAYGETLTGSIEYSQAGSSVQPINYVGHMGTRRQQGDFDVWYYEAAQGDKAVISVTSTEGDLVPRLLVIAEEDVSVQFDYPTTYGWDDNVDGDAQAGVCVRNAVKKLVGIIVDRQKDTKQTGAYTLTVEQAADDQELAGGSVTAVCRVGTFAFTNGDYRVNIRQYPSYHIIGVMQPGQPYLVLSPPEAEWTTIGIWWQGYIANGAVKSNLVHIAGDMNDAEAAAK